MSEFNDYVADFESEEPTDDLQIEYFGTSVRAPEHRLYFAIIHRALLDYEELCMKVARLARRGPVNRLEREWMEQHRKQSIGSAMQTYCDFVDFPLTHLGRKYDSLDQQYGISQVTWTNEATCWQRYEKGLSSARKYLSAN